MTILLQGQVFLGETLAGTAELSSRPERSVVEGPAVSFPGTHTPSKALIAVAFTARLKPCPWSSNFFSSL
jgi:hypothetical protein